MKKIIIGISITLFVIFTLIAILGIIIILTTDIDKVTKVDKPTQTKQDYLKTNTNIKIEQNCYINVSVGNLNYSDSLSKFDLKDNEKIIHVKIKFVNDSSDMLYTGSFYAINTNNEKLNMYYGNDDSSIFEAIPPHSVLKGNIYFKYIETKYITILYDHCNNDSIKKIKIMVK